MNVNQEQETKLCQMCQNYGDHITAKCPKLICAECDERGHAKKHCPYLAETESKNSNDEKRRKDLQLVDDRKWNFDFRPKPKLSAKYAEIRPKLSAESSYIKIT